MKRSKSLFLSITALLSIALVACEPKDSKDNLNYDSIYAAPNEVVSPKSGVAMYVAQDGYLGNKREQGYNHFYYQYKEGTNYTDLSLNSKNEFSGDGVSIINDKMTSSSTKMATRLFKAPTAGLAKIKNTIKLEKGSSIKVEIFQNSSLIKTVESNKDSAYFEVDATIAKNDEIRFVLASESTVSYDPIIDFVGGIEKSLHHAADGFYGDVHPFYNEEEHKLYMYYLSTGNQRNSKQTQTFSTMLTSSYDMFHFENDLCQMNDRKRPEQDLYYVLNVYKDKEGLFRSSPGGNLKACNSVSTDLHTWENGQKATMNKNGDIVYKHMVPFAQGVCSGRDPDTFYDKETDSYYTIVINYYTPLGASGEKHLTMYIGDGEGLYGPTGYKLISFTNKGDPECPEIRKIGKRWYVFYSEGGTGTKGNVGALAYRVGPENVLPQDVDWNSMPEYFLDGGDLHAAQVFNVADKWYVYGWINYEPNKSVWGGYLNLPHEVIIKEDGTLGTKFDEKCLELLNKGLVSSYEGLVGENTNLARINRHLVKGTFTSDQGSFTLGNHKIGIKTDGFKKYLYCSYSSYNNLLEIPQASQYDITLVKDGNFYEIYCNQTNVLTCHVGEMNEINLGVNGFVKDVSIYKLADYVNIYY